MKAKYQKEEQTDSSAPLSILAMSISLALSPDCGHSATPAGQAWVSGVILTSQNRNTWSTYTDIPIFLALKSTKTSLNVTVSVFIRYVLIYIVPLKAQVCLTTPR